MPRLLEIKRMSYGPEWTIGLIQTPKLQLFSMERPWLNNAPSISCIPEGAYSLEAHSSAKYPQVWALVGDQVAHYPKTGVERAAILIHAANWVQELEGCVAPGFQIAWLKRQVAVTNSQGALAALRDEIKDPSEWLVRISHV